jgi:translation initiation factor 1
VYQQIEKSKQNLRVWLEKKPPGKKVTIVRGFLGPESELKKLGKKLRSLCHVGGTTKNREIMIQGNVRDKVIEYLIKIGYNAKPSGS